MDAVEEALDTLAQAARDPKARMLGLSGPLETVARGMARLRLDQVTIARAILKLHYWPGESLKPDMFESIVRIAGSE